VIAASTDGIANMAARHNSESPLTSQRGMPVE
jgi:hypothetical protein